MARKVTEWPSERGPITKIMSSDGCKGMHFPWLWDGGLIFTKLDVIWGMSDKSRSNSQCQEADSMKKVNVTFCLVVWLGGFGAPVCVQG